MDVRLDHIASGALGCILLVLGGCADILGLKGGSAPVHYYVLSSASTPQAGQQDAAAKYSIGVGIPPIQVPEYLDGRMIVTRTTPNTVDLAELHNWAAPLSEHVTAVLADNLSTLIPTDAVLRLPFDRAIPIDYEVRVRLETFERDDDGDVKLLARWAVFDERTGEAAAVKTSRYQAPVAVTDRGPAQAEERSVRLTEEYEAIVAAMSRVLADLSREIAAEIRTAANRSRSQVRSGSAYSGHTQRMSGTATATISTSSGRPIRQ